MTKPGCSFFGSFSVVVYFVMDACLNLLSLLQFFSSKRLAGKNNNNNNIHICIAPYGRNYRGAIEHI